MPRRKNYLAQMEQSIPLQTGQNIIYQKEKRVQDILFTQQQLEVEKILYSMQKQSKYLKQYPNSYSKLEKIEELKRRLYQLPILDPYKIHIYNQTIYEQRRRQRAIQCKYRPKSISQYIPSPNRNPHINPQKNPNPQPNPQPDPQKPIQPPSEIQKPNFIDAPEKQTEQQQEQQRVTDLQVYLLAQNGIKLSDFKKFYAQTTIQVDGQTIIMSDDKPLLAIASAFLQLISKTQNKKLFLHFKSLVFETNFQIYIDQHQQIKELLQNDNNLKALVLKIIQYMRQKQNIYQFMCDFDIDTYYQFAIRSMLLFSKKVQQYNAQDNDNLLQVFAQCFGLQFEGNIKQENFKLFKQNQSINFHREQGKILITFIQ